MTVTTRSEEVFQRLCEVIPGGVNSPVRSCRAVNHHPLVAESAVGDLLWDVDGREFIDYCMSWGPLIHGHSHPKITQAIQNQLVKGTTYGITTELEEKLCRKIIELMPTMEMVRLVSSGTEATMTAVRLARGYTERDLIIKFAGNFHGHADSFLVQAGSGVMELSTASSKGIPEDFVKYTLCLPYNDVQAVKKVFKENKNKIACVIIEPMAGNMGVIPASQEFLEVLREETEKDGALLIFDEVITGFRVAKGGCHDIYGITPDITCIGKIIGGGLPAAGFGGKRKIMEHLAPLGKVYQGGTLSGNPLAMVAGLTSLEMLDEPGFYEELDRKTDFLLKPIVAFIQKNSLNACIQRVGSMFTLFFGQRKVQNMEDAKACDREQFAKFFAFMFSKGIYIPPLQQEAWFISSAHTENHLKRTQETILEFLSN